MNNAGRPRKYPLNSLAVGESVIIPWRLTADGRIGNQKPIHDSIKQEERRYDRQFKTQGEKDGILVTRVR